ncbi:unnamed protein product [Paramecium pentaurelia]|uniref:Uncharacterized protein n=1 Tax=Paramecium pentaurelia TaxID=43138 RepID=A0A8S1V579_9CILI|nr:unnamed protein product [Paramecium pentaurelia]
MFVKGKQYKELTISSDDFMMKQQMIDYSKKSTLSFYILDCKIEKQKSESLDD